MYNNYETKKKEKVKIITVKVSDKTIKEMEEFYEDLKRPTTPQYAKFQAKDGDTVVTLYESGKAVFQGFDADMASEYWIQTEKINTGKVEYKDSSNKETKKETKVDPDYTKYHNTNSVGSDEVGTGDYFGPIVVSSTYVTKEDIPFLESLGVCDSKKISDDKILKIAPQIAKRVKYRSMVLTNKDYNNFKGEYNMNKIKAILHNKVLYQIVHEENPHYDYLIVDQFCMPNKYYEYIEESTLKQTDITFMTKAEDKCMSVACASIISRYIFLKEFDKLSDSLHMPLPKGAGKDVDKIGEEIVEKYGKDKLNEVAKLNFMNTSRILHTQIF